jgi:hypothetical protein
MLEQLFFRSDALTRQLSAPLVGERRQYLLQCASQGMARRTLLAKARLLLSITEYLRLAERPYVKSLFQKSRKLQIDGQPKTGLRQRVRMRGFREMTS